MFSNLKDDIAPSVRRMKGRRATAVKQIRSKAPVDTAERAPAPSNVIDISVQSRLLRVLDRFPEAKSEVLKALREK